MTHPVDEIRGQKSTVLTGKVIVLGVTGSIAATETVKLSRELIRHGADVIPVMTPHATQILHPYALEFATGNKVITHLTGDIEHVNFCGDVSTKADALVISPCTANTLSKIACGIDDTPVTTFATTALGSHIPVLLSPAMHSSMYHHPRVQDNLSICTQMGISVLSPQMMEGKAKMVSTETIVAYVQRACGNKHLVNKKVLVIGGATTEPLDDVRVITNLSSGRMAVAIAQEAFYQGGEVEFWYGYGVGKSVNPPSYVTVKEFFTVDDLLSLISQSPTFHIIINCAAISDYRPDKRGGKIPAGREFSLQLYPTPSINTELRTKAMILVGFKLEASRKNIVDKAHKRLLEQDLDYVIANTLDSLGGTHTTLSVITRDKKVMQYQGEKEQLAKNIFTIFHDR